MSKPKNRPWESFRVTAILESLFARLSWWADTMSKRFAYCRDCGRNRYTGRACK